MGLFISERIRKREFGKLISDADKTVLLDGARPALAHPIGGKDLPKGTRLLKVYATTKRGPRRILYLLVVANGDLFVLFYRDKKDPVGENMSSPSTLPGRHREKQFRSCSSDFPGGVFEGGINVSAAVGEFSVAPVNLPRRHVPRRERGRTTRRHRFAGGTSSVWSAGGW